MAQPLLLTRSHSCRLVCGTLFLFFGLTGCEPAPSPPPTLSPQADAGEPVPANDAGASEMHIDLQSWTTYLALGSSSTVGAGASEPDHTGYVPLLLANLQSFAPGLRLVNRGQGGARISSYLSVLDELVALQPDVVTVLPFTDYVRTSTDDFEAGYTQLIDALANAGAQIWMGDLRIDPELLCGVGSGPGGCYGEADFRMLQEKNERLAAMAATRPALHVVGILDQNVAHPEFVAADGHPNDAGHQYLADSFWEHIAQEAQLSQP